MVYGPREIACAHAPKEWVSLETKSLSARVMVGAVDRMVHRDSRELHRLNARLFPKPRKASAHRRKRWPAAGPRGSGQPEWNATGAGFVSPVKGSPSARRCPPGTGKPRGEAR